MSLINKSIVWIGSKALSRWFSLVWKSEAAVVGSYCFAWPNNSYVKLDHTKLLHAIRNKKKPCSYIQHVSMYNTYVEHQIPPCRYLYLFVGGSTLIPRFYILENVTILQVAVKAAQARLEGDIKTIIPEYPEERHLACALLAWQQLGHSETDSLCAYAHFILFTFHIIVNRLLSR